ncbi:MAG: hypothetical protein WD397_11590 [Wenzhouxiangellaceae bacterium]
MNQEGRPLADTALRQVLESESRARGRIAGEERKAAAALEAARADGRQIEADAVVVARQFQAACAEQVEARVTRLRESAEQRLAQIESESVLPRIEAAAEAVARELVSAGSGDKSAGSGERVAKGEA